jgi:hypothetical protein
MTKPRWTPWECLHYGPCYYVVMRERGSEREYLGGAVEKVTSYGSEREVVNHWPAVKYDSLAEARAARDEANGPDVAVDDEGRVAYFMEAN